MTDIKVVIGANFGDEGKGLMTDFFCNKAKENNKTCIVVCSNGGSQRGHTVETPDGIRHVFHHFGSGSFVGASTYLSEDFIINPMVFVKEFEELKDLGYLPSVYINRNCKVSTPYDMIANQIIEENRGENRHGSCGLGIWETIKRYQEDDDNTYIGDLSNKFFHQKLWLYLIQNFWLQKELQNMEVNEHWNDLIHDTNIFKHYIEDLNTMLSYCTLVDSDDFIADYDVVVFENGQGLMLDQNIKGYGEHTTPSNTGFKNPAKIIKNIFNDDVNVEVCYVTRTYFTRHGAGRFDEECDMNDINPDIVDLTNQPNQHQGIIRYGKIDDNGFNGITKRIWEDATAEDCGKNINISLAVTHMNEYELNSIESHPCVCYISDGKTREDVIVVS